MKSRWLLLVALGAFPLAAAAADWPQWRGPQRDGLSRETGLLPEWPKEGPKLLWQVKDVGAGYSTPAVVGDRIYLLSNKGTDDEFTQALDAKDGSQLWSVRLGKSGPNKGPQYPGARSTPTVDGDVLYALGSDGDLACLETAKGEALAQEPPHRLRRSARPVGLRRVAADRRRCAGLHARRQREHHRRAEQEDRRSDLAFAAPKGDQAAYASVIIVEVGGVKQYVQFLQNGLVGLDANTGKLLWHYDKTAQGSMANIPTPVAHDGYVYSAAGMSGGGLVHLKADKGDIAADPIYFDSDLPNCVGGSVHIGDYLYGANSARGLLSVEFATGKTKWEEKSLGAGSVCAADGRLYFHGEDGQVALAEATPDGYHNKGRFTPPDPPSRPNKAKAWAYPVIANGRLYVRDQACCGATT